MNLQRISRKPAEQLVDESSANQREESPPAEQSVDESSAGRKSTSTSRASTSARVSAKATEAIWQISKTGVQ